MKTNSMLLASLAVVALGASRVAAADLSVSVFYDALEPHGEWIEASDYGYVWTPRGVDADWRPYTDGQWVYTDAGWTWVSEEPYSWAVYHYGRWVNLEQIGWSWVPDTEWGPAWVSWRHSDRYVGWAPLPPESRETIRVGVNLGNWVDTYYDIGPTYYSFVEVRNLGAPRLRAVVLPPRENITIIQQTTNITNVVVRNNIVVNEGPDYNVISRQSAQPIRKLKLERQVDIAGDVRSSDRFRPRIQGDSLAIPAPRIQAAATNAAPRKVARRLETVAVNRGWKDAGDIQKVESFRSKLQAEAKPPQNLPPLQHRDRKDGAGTPDRTTVRTGNEPDTDTRPPAPGRDSRAPGDASRPTAGTARTPGDDPNRPTAETNRPPADENAPGAGTRGAAARRAPGDSTRPSAETTRPDKDPTRPGAATPDAKRPVGSTPDATAPKRPGTVPTPDPAAPNRLDRPGQPSRPGAERDGGQQKKGDRRGESLEGTLPQREANPGNPERPETPPSGEERNTRPTPGASDQPVAPNRPGANDRPRTTNRPERESNRPDAPKADPDRPDGARAGNPRTDRPQSAPAAGVDRPDRPRAEGPNDNRNPGRAERARPGSGPGATQDEGPASDGRGSRPGKAEAGKTGKDREKKDGE